MKNKLSNTSRILLIAAAAALFLVLFTPIWRIELDAPQYPEGLHLSIHANGLKGNVDIINGLNHYIGMKTLHNEDFIEFKILPYCIVFFALLFVSGTLLNNRKWLNTIFLLFVVFGIVAMIDFWRWEYNYGHNLNPNAAIVVPGMAYQPPLIGFKQLLNFGAYSIPDTGGWIFIGAGVILLVCVVLEWKKYKDRLKNSPSYKAILLLTLTASFGLQGCSSSPQPLKTGIDNCTFCKMTISDPKFGAELITKKGKIYKFDDIHCMVAFLKEEATLNTENSDIYVTDYTDSHTLYKSTESFLLQAESIHGPMNGHTIAFSNKDSIKMAAARLKGNEVPWNTLLK